MALDSGVMNCFKALCNFVLGSMCHCISFVTDTYTV